MQKTTDGLETKSTALSTALSAQHTISREIGDFLEISRTVQKQRRTELRNRAFPHPQDLAKNNV